MDILGSKVHDNMAHNSNNQFVQQGVALWKSLNLITFILGGEGLLVFFGNEFGQPDPVVFPTRNNNWCHKKATRLWSLSENRKLHFYHMNKFTKALIHFIRANHQITSAPVKVLNLEHNKFKVQKGDFIIAGNFGCHQFDFSDLGEPLLTTSENNQLKHEYYWAGVFKH